MSDALRERIDALLPQTQCTRCGFEGCGPYAEAIADGRADINRCPPGGEAGIRALAALLSREAKPLDPDCGAERPRCVAFIDEPRCIGCTLCIQACPVDAIVGAPRQMHTVVAELCTGCDLCVAPCPVDCIAMLPASEPAWDPARAMAARSRFDARRARLDREAAEREARLAQKAAERLALADPRKRAAIQAAIARARARRAAAPQPAPPDGEKRS